MTTGERLIKEHEDAYSMMGISNAPALVKAIDDAIAAERQRIREAVEALSVEGRTLNAGWLVSRAAVIAAIDAAGEKEGE